MKKPSKREQTLYALRVAGYHLDSEAFLRLRIDNRVSYEVALENWYRGQDIKKLASRADVSSAKQHNKRKQQRKPRS